MSNLPTELGESQNKTEAGALRDAAFVSLTPGSSVSGDFSLGWTQPSTMLQAALDYAARGHRVFPLHRPEPAGRCSCGRADCAPIGKHPRTRHGVKDATTDPEEIRVWWSEWPDANIGLACDRMVVLDLDSAEAIAEAERRHGGVPATPTVETGKGRHLYFEAPANQTVKNTVGRIGAGIDVRAPGGYVVAPPSLHQSGRRYRWAVGLALDVPLAPLPVWALAKPEGGRNDALTSEVGRLFMRGLDEKAVREAAIAWNAEHCDPPLSEREVETVIMSVARRHARSGDGRGLEFEYSDKGTGERFVAEHGDDLRYVRVLRRWFVWDGIRWKEDETLALVAGQLHLFLDTEQQRAAGAVAAASDQSSLRAAQQRVSAVARLWSRNRMQAVLAVAQELPPVAAEAGAFDGAPWLLNVANGILDLRERTLRPHDRTAMMTKLAPVKFDPSAIAPQWERFFAEVLEGDPEVIGFLRRVAGLALVGAQLEHLIAFLYGTGANGKSVTLEVLRSVLGDYAAVTPFTTFLLGRGQEATGNDVVRLRGARLVTASEAGESQRFDEVRLKQLTGGDRVTARPLYGEYVEFTPQFTLLLATNYEPQVSGTDEGIWRRICQVPFTYFVPPEQRDPLLAERLRAEGSGILNWALAGLHEYLDGGLRAPERVQRATQAYREEQDIVGRWLEENIMIGLDPAKASVAKSVIYDNYRGWCKASGHLPLSKINLGKRLRVRKPQIEERKSNGVDSWLGVEIKTWSGHGDNRTDPSAMDRII
jgi:putative DNA primase/helicase